ncbi:MAG: glutathione S-transferase N-terminal domain-containing protein [Alphaproteobacteria bacterium]|nr:glutathione S-transferase N-terminal domain-containing protein [Alphaproteobacteria bacterium]
MMKLRSTPMSPFGRMVKIAAYVTGLMDSITVEQSNTMDDHDTIRQQNPLGKIPALILDDRVLYDSRVIIEYLDHLAGGGTLIPTETEARFDALRRNALANGILDAALLVIYEARFRPEDKHVESFVDYQRDKIRRALNSIAEAAPVYRNGATPDLGEIGLACCLDYLDFRKQLDWRDHCPDMAQWMMDFSAAVPGYKDTLPPEIDPAPWR